MYFDGNVTVDDPQVRYFNGSDLNIMSINANNDTKVSNGFFAIISLVPIKANYIEECQVQTNDDGTIAISDIDYENGYKPLSTCSYNFSIPIGHEAILSVFPHFLEAGVDKLTVSKGNKSFDLKNNGYFKIQKEFNGSIFKFVADGNTQQAGFSAVYSTFDFFTIEPTANLQNTSWLAIYVNENLTHNFTNYAPDQILPYPRNTNITVVFHSGQSSSPFFIGPPNWSIETKAISLSKTKIQLNSTSPTFAIYLDNVKADEAFTVCSPNDDILELFVTKEKNMNVLDLYDSDDFNNFVDT
uniref:CUB domain-containing protein n=1 Tax=Panagrolaimus davidi TaxID=227884 RepID=A0A914R0X2_9BILA